MCDGVCISKKLCNNEFHSTQMKRILLTSLASLLVMSSLGHVFAAAFCPRPLGGGCCLAKTDRSHASSTHQHRAAHCSAMSAAVMDVGSMDRMPRHEIAMGDAATVDTSSRLTPTIVNQNTFGNRFEQPIEPCRHCLTHSGIVNAPVSIVSVQSGREIYSGLLPIPGFLVRPAIAIAQMGLPREHAPPDRTAPRHILNSVFLI
jgi:hypothetical protein